VAGVEHDRPTGRDDPGVLGEAQDLVRTELAAIDRACSRFRADSEIDPRTGQPATPVWRTATVAAHRCVAANTMTTAAMVRGKAALNWLRRLKVPARLVTDDRRVMVTGGWPA
jgi:hypothetical protein